MGLGERPGRPAIVLAAEMALSPDGSRLVFVALAADGTRKLWLRRFDAVDSRSIEGSEDAHYPFWSPSAHSIETGIPRALFATGITGSFVDRFTQYVVTRDGQRFLVNISAEDDNSAPITVVLKWDAAAPPR